MKKCLNKKGFTMIELLGAIVILGILSVLAITSISRLLNKAKNTQDDQQESILVTAAESYMQANRDRLPKSIGETVTVTAQTLKNKHYLKSDINNSKGEDCMPNTFVKVYKSSKTKYDYTPVVLCGDEEYEEGTAPKPTIDLYFSDDTGKRNTEVLKNISKATMYLTISGGEYKDDEIPEGEDKKIAIDGYSYVISVQTKDNPTVWREAYNSGTLSGNNLTDIVVTRRISDFVDLSGATNFMVEVTVINKKGGKEVKLDDASHSNQATYQDPDKPHCVTISGAAVNENDWINKSQAAEGRTITATCEDAKGSGCIRPTFSRSWPNDQQEDAEWGYIQVTDNSGNTNILDNQLELTASSLCNVAATTDSCRVRVNVDKKLPTIKVLGAYRIEADGTIKDSTASTYTRGIEVSDDTPDGYGIINDTEYTDLEETWMNNAKYPGGVAYKIQISDNIHLAKWTWETNASYLTSDNNNAYRTYSSDGDGAASEVITSGTDGNCGTLEKTITIKFTEEGRRKGILRVYDKANNETKLEIEANLDRTPPRVPDEEHIIYTYSDNGTKTYTPGSTKWINKEVTAKVLDTMQLDNTSGPSKVTLSGWKRFVYHITKDYAPNSAEEADGEKVIFDDNYEGKNNVEFKSCDHANNCSKYSGLKPIWVDFTAPTCKIDVQAKTTNDSSWSTYTSKQSSYGWLGIGETARVLATCVEDGTNNDDGVAKASGCYSAAPTWKITFNHVYSDDIETSNAGANGENDGGKVRDRAGNETSCSSKNTVKIDHKRPSCTITGEATSWRKKGTTVTKSCVDSGLSGCVSNVISSVAYNTDGKTYGVMTQKNAYTVIDKADNTPTGKDKEICDRTSMNVYVDKQKPTCEGTKSHQDTTDGVTITYKCGDNNGSGVKNCPGGSDHKETGIKDTVKYTVYDKVDNYMTCTVKVTAYKQYKYIKKNVAKTCTKSCCGTKTCKSGSCCGWITHTGQDCRNCGSHKQWSSYGGYKAYQYCPSGYYGGRTCTSKIVNSLGTVVHYNCKCYKSVCNRCTWNVTQKTCTKSCCGYYTCTSGSCCGYACGSEWTGWGASSTGCSSKSRKLYK